MATIEIIRARLRWSIDLRWAALALLLVFGVALLPLNHPGPATQHDRADATVLAPPTVESSLFVRPLGADEALRINAAMPFAMADSPPAEPFRPLLDKDAQENALNCLAATIYYEADGQGAAGAAAVAQVVLNRVRHPAYPSSVCGVVFQGSNLSTGCQFTFTCDGSLNRVADHLRWTEALRAAKAALLGEVYRPVGLSTHYHANYVVPYWAPRLAKNSQIGDHIFYRLPGAWGSPDAFRQRSSPTEPDYFQLRAAALMGRGTWASLEDSGHAARIHFRIDPRLELARVVAVLGQLPTARAGAYERETRSYFADAVDDPAVAFLRDGQQKKALLPSLMMDVASDASLRIGPNGSNKIIQFRGGKGDLSPELADALTEFARNRDFDGFVRAHRQFYRKTIAQAEVSAPQDAADWAAYTGIDLPSDPIPLSAIDLDSSCAADGKAEAQDNFVITRTKLQGLIGVALYQQAASRPSSKKRLPASAKAIATAELCTWQMVVHGVFARIADLSRQKSTRKAEKSFAGKDVPKSLIDGLKIYEKRRDQYPTLAEFLPTLLRSVKTNAPVQAPVEVATSPSPPRGCKLAVTTFRFNASNPDSCIESP